MLRIAIPAAALAAALALPAPPALAGPNEGPSDAAPLITVTQRVSYGDLDLTSRIDAQVMLRRIREAAVQACAQPRSPLFPTVETTMARCAARSTDQAVASVDSPVLTAEYGRSLYGPLLAAAGR